jgi:hypothetical protein
MRNHSVASPDHTLPLAGFRARELVPACFAFAISFSIYLFTLSPSIVLGDSGELITAAVTLGNAHPPGYPLWLLLAKFFSLLPIGPVAYRINLMSALLDAASIGILTLVISRTLPRVCARVISREAFESPAAALITGSAAAAATLILAFSPTFWHQSVIGEVYALNNFIVCLLLLILALWGEAPHRGAFLFAASFLFGAGQANHQTLLLMAPAIALYVTLVRPRALLSPRIVFGCFFLFLLGLAFYLYLPLRASAQPPINWGNPATWDSFWFHVLRKQYRVIEVVRPLAVFMPQVKFFFASIPAESLPTILLLPALLTIGFAHKEGRLWLLFNLTAFVCTGVVFVVIANTELDLNAQDILKIYFLPAYIIVAILLGYGIGVIGLLALRASRRLRLKIMPATTVAILWFVLPLSSLLLNFSTASMRGRDFGLVYGELLMNTLPHGAVLFAGTDSAYAVPMYLKWVEGRRPDIAILNFNRLADQKYVEEARRNAPDLEFLNQQDYAEAVSALAPAVKTDGSGVYGFRPVTRLNEYMVWKLVQRNGAQKSMYFDQGMPVELLNELALPAGLVMKLESVRIEPMPSDAVKADTAYWTALEKQLLASDDFRHDTDARQKFSKCRSNIGALYFHHKMYAEAETAMRQAIRFSDRNMEAYAFLALIRKEQGLQAEAVRLFDDYLKRDPWNTSARDFAEWLRK